MRAENKAMMKFLENKGLRGVAVKYIREGSLKGTWRLCKRSNEPGKLFETWTEDAAAELNALGFVDFQGKPLGQFSGNGGMWQTFVRGHNELLTA